MYYLSKMYFSYCTPLLSTSLSSCQSSQLLIRTRRNELCAPAVPLRRSVCPALALSGCNYNRKAFGDATVLRPEEQLRAQKNSNRRFLCVISTPFPPSLLLGIIAANKLAGLCPWKHICSEIDLLPCV